MGSVLNNGMGNRCDCRHCEQNKAHGQEQDWSQIATEIAPRSEERRWENERWQTEVKDEIGLQPERRKVRNETDGQTPKHEQDGIGNLEFA